MKTDTACESPALIWEEEQAQSLLEEYDQLMARMQIIRTKLEDMGYCP